MESMYIVRVTEDNETFDYEYGNIEHAEEQYNTEKYSYITGICKRKTLLCKS